MTLGDETVNTLNIIDAVVYFNQSPSTQTQFLPLSDRTEMRLGVVFRSLPVAF